MSITPTWRTPPRIVLAGQTFEESRTVQRVTALRALGCDVRTVATTPENQNYETPPTLLARIRHRLRRPADPAGTNAAILDALGGPDGPDSPDSPGGGADILWLDAADMVTDETLAEAKRRIPGLAVVWYSEDDMMNRRLRTVYLENAMPYIDLWVTTKSFNLHPGEMPSLGVGRMLFVNNSYDPDIHRTVDISDEERGRYGAPVSFIGTFEEPRANSVLHLARAGYDVRVWGNGWDNMKNRHANLRIEGRPVYNDAFAKVVAASDINLCFLRHANRDLQTCRSVEIPGCGGFMAHERNPEITALFREDEEAAYFETDDELVSVCARWLDEPERRRRIAEAGQARARDLGLDHRTNMTRIINELVNTGKVAGA